MAKASGVALPGTPTEVKVPPPSPPEPIDDSIDGLLRRVARGGRSELVALPLDRIEVLPGFVNVRGHNEGESLKVDDLLDSIKVEGQRFPAAAGVQLDESGTPHVYLEDGFRRREALRRLSAEDSRFDTMNVIVESATSADIAFRNIISHMRKGVPAIMIAVRLTAMEDLSIPRTEIAARLGMSLGSVAQYIQVVRRLCPEALQAGLAGRISYRLLREIIAHPAEVQIKLLEAAAAAQRELGEEGSEVNENSATRAAAAGLREKAAELQAAGKIAAPKEKGKKKEKAADSTSDDSGGDSSGGEPGSGQAALPEEPVPAEIPAHNRLPEGELRRRLNLAYQIGDEMNADDRDDVRLLSCLQVDYEELNSAGAALQGYIAGWGAALMYLTGEKCSDCDAEMIKLPHDGRKNLPIEHVHSSAE